MDLNQYVKLHLGQRVIEVPDQGNDMIVVEGPCGVSREQYSTRPFNKKGLILWNRGRGEHIQHAIPDLSKDDREFLISGTSPKGWAQLFPPEEEG